MWLNTNKTLLILSASIVILLGGSLWFYFTAFHINVDLQRAQTVGKTWEGHKPLKTSIRVEFLTKTWTTYRGYLHRDWEVQRSACAPGPSRCRYLYTYTVLINGQNGQIDDAMITIHPGDWPLSLVHHRRSRGS